MKTGKKAEKVFSGRWPRRFFLLCVILVAVMIFLFSSQSGTDSSRLSDKITKIVVHFFYPDYEMLEKTQQQSLWKQISYFIRKSAHFLEYCALGFFLDLFLHSISLGRSGFFAWIGSSFYAVTDEMHQYIIGTRTAMWQDVLLDSAGALTGCLVAFALIIILLKIEQKATRKKAE